jgi:hypothetical protein
VTKLATAPSTVALSAPKRRGRKPDQAAAAREREARSASGVCELLARRPELRGVLAAADWLDEATRWSV